MKEKGFTLLELLAVIVILSVITLITVPMVMNVIEESKKKALVSSVQGILDSTNYFTMSHEKGVYEFLFDEEHKGSTLKGEKLEYKGNIDGEGKLYLDKEGNTSICISNDKYYAYKNYNSGIIVGNKKTGNCIIGFDALTNKYVAMLDNGTGNISNVYSKDEVNNLVDDLDNKITNNTNEITNIKSDIEELQNNLNNYALQSELNKTNTNVENLSSLVSHNTESINHLSDSILTPEFTQTSKGLDSINAVKIGNLGIVTRRQVLSSNSSGIKEINIELPFVFESATLTDNAYGMHYKNETGTTSVGNIIFSQLIFQEGSTKIIGYVNYPTKTSYQMYNYTVIGKIKE